MRDNVLPGARPSGLCPCSPCRFGGRAGRLGRESHRLFALEVSRFPDSELHGPDSESEIGRSRPGVGVAFFRNRLTYRAVPIPFKGIARSLVKSSFSQESPGVGVAFVRNRLTSSSHMAVRCGGLDNKIESTTHPVARRRTHMFGRTWEQIRKTAEQRRRQCCSVAKRT